MIDALLERIGLHPRPEPDVDGLRELHRAYLAAVPYEDIAVQLGETAPARRGRADRARVRRRPRRLLLRAQHGAGGAAAGVRVRRHPPPGGRGRRGADEPHGAARPPRRRALAGRLRPGRGLRRAAAVPRGRDDARARSPTRSTREEAGTWWVGQHEWTLVPRLPDGRGGVARSRTSTSTTAGSRTDPESSFVKTLRRPEPAAGPDRHRCARGRCRRSGRTVDTKRVLERDEFAAVLRAEFGLTVGGERLERLWEQRRRPARSVPGARMMQVATHPGNFHADDVFAVAVLQLVHGELEVVRTRDDAVARRRPRRHRRALERRHRRLRPPPARRRGRARQRHPLRQLRPGVARVRRGAGGLARTRRTRSTSAWCRASTPTTPARTSPPRWSRASGR